MLAHERRERFRGFDVMLRGRADSLLGAVQDAEDVEDNLLIDMTGLELPLEDMYEIRDESGHLVGKISQLGGEECAQRGWFLPDGSER